jgi:hypothetical protein
LLTIWRQSAVALPSVAELFALVKKIVAESNVNSLVAVAPTWENETVLGTC